MNWHDVFLYDRHTGVLIWKAKSSKYSNVSIGDCAGCLNSNGYYQIRYSNKQYYTHRIIWELHNGPIPKDIKIDHIDKNKSNNKIQNLRLASMSQNSSNHSLYKNNTSGYTGVVFDPNKKTWIAQIQYNNKTIRKHGFTSKEDAYRERQNLEIKYHKNFSQSYCEV